AVAGGIHGIEYLAEVLAPIAQDVQHRTKYLPFDPTDIVDLDQGGRDEGPVLRGGRQGKLQHVQSRVAHLPYMVSDALRRFGVDDGTDIGGEMIRIADTQFVHGAAQHLQEAVRAIVLYAENAQGRATLSDRKSTRLNSSHVKISYAVFCLKKKNEEIMA